MALGGCGPGAPAGGSEVVTKQREPIVYGADDRKEFFEAPAGAQAIVSSSMAALIPNRLIAPTNDGLVASTPDLAEQDNLCLGERFALEPSAAFCSGVLVDWDLILTAGHCARVLALDEFSVVFGYYYMAPGVLAFSSVDVAEPVEIVAEALSPEGVEPQLDYAWIRLSKPVHAPLRPAPIYVRPRNLEAGEPFMSTACSRGTPMKIDPDALVADPRVSSADYFLASSDTSAGASGGGAFDDRGALLGILARGGADYVVTDAGCSATNYVPDGGAPQEQYTYANQAVAGLCGDGGAPESICRRDCGDPCTALGPPLETDAAGGCSVLPSRARGPKGHLGVAMSAAFGVAVPWLRARRRRKPSPSR